MERGGGGAGGDPTSEVTCGICLSDCGRSIRGRIDSCEHYFCFVCIMEWAKVETRCPMCKIRFRSIRRPTVPGIFLFERVVDVTERNQDGATFEASLDWLCLNLPGNELPLKFSSGSTSLAPEGILKAYCFEILILLNVII